MSTDAAVTTFADALERVDVELTRVPAAEAADAVADAVEEPAVGVPVDVDGVELAGVADDPDTDLTLDPTPTEIEAARTGVTGAGLGIAEYGSVVVEGTPAGEEPVSLFVRRHVAVLRRSDLVAEMPDAIDAMAERAAEGVQQVIATGPSATADMGALVKGAHGPETVHVVLVEDR